MTSLRYVFISCFEFLDIGFANFNNFTVDLCGLCHCGLYLLKLHFLQKMQGDHESNGFAVMKKVEKSC